MKLTIGVMGSSGGDLAQGVRQKAYQLGEAIAAREAILITGGCPGLPYDAARGARARVGVVAAKRSGSPMFVPRLRTRRAPEPRWSER